MAAQSAGAVWKGLLRYTLCPEPLCTFTEEDDIEFEDAYDVILAAYFTIKLVVVLHVLCGSPVTRLLSALLRWFSGRKQKDTDVHQGLSSTFKGTVSGRVLEGKELLPATVPLHEPPDILQSRSSHGQAPPLDGISSADAPQDISTHSWKRGKSIKDRYVDTPGIHGSASAEHPQPQAAGLLPQLAPAVDLSLRPRFFTPSLTLVKGTAPALAAVSESKVPSPAGSAHASKSPAQRLLFQDSIDTFSHSRAAASSTRADDQDPQGLQDTEVAVLFPALAKDVEDAGPDVFSPRDKGLHNRSPPCTIDRLQDSVHPLSRATSNAWFPEPTVDVEMSDSQAMTCSTNPLFQPEGAASIFYHQGYQEQGQPGDGVAPMVQQAQCLGPAPTAEQPAGFDISLGGWADPAQQAVHTSAPTLHVQYVDALQHAVLLTAQSDSLPPLACTSILLYPGTTHQLAEGNPDGCVDTASTAPSCGASWCDDLVQAAQACDHEMQLDQTSEWLQLPAQAHGCDQLQACSHALNIARPTDAAVEAPQYTAVSDAKAMQQVWSMQDRIASQVDTSQLIREIRALPCELESVHPYHAWGAEEAVREQQQQRLDEQGASKPDAIAGLAWAVENTQAVDAAVSDDSSPTQLHPSSVVLQGMAMSSWPRLREGGPPSACTSPHLPTSSSTSPERMPSAVQGSMVCSLVAAVTGPAGMPLIAAVDVGGMEDAGLHREAAVEGPLMSADEAQPDVRNSEALTLADAEDLAGLEGLATVQSYSSPSLLDSIQAWEAATVALTIGERADDFVGSVADASNTPCTGVAAVVDVGMQELQHLDDAHPGEVFAGQPASGCLLDGWGTQVEDLFRDDCADSVDSGAAAGVPAVAEGEHQQDGAGVYVPPLELLDLTNISLDVWQPMADVEARVQQGFDAPVEPICSLSSAAGTCSAHDEHNERVDTGVTEAAAAAELAGGEQLGPGAQEPVQEAAPEEERWEAWPVSCDVMDDTAALWLDDDQAEVQEEAASRAGGQAEQEVHVWGERKIARADDQEQEEGVRLRQPLAVQEEVAGDEPAPHSSGGTRGELEFGDFCDASSQVADASWLEVVSQMPVTPATIGKNRPQLHSTPGGSAATLRISTERMFAVGSTIVTKDWARRRTTGSITPSGPQHAAYSTPTPAVSFSAALDAAASAPVPCLTPVTCPLPKVSSPDSSPACAPTLDHAPPASAAAEPCNNSGTGALMFDKCGRPIILRTTLFTPSSNDSTANTTPATNGLRAALNVVSAVRNSLQQEHQPLAFPALEHAQTEATEHTAGCMQVEPFQASTCTTPAPSSPVHWHNSSSTAFSLPPTSPVQFAGLSAAPSPAKSEFMAPGTSQGQSSRSGAPRMLFTGPAGAPRPAPRGKYILRAGRRPGEFRIEDRRSLTTRYVNIFPSPHAHSSTTTATGTSILPAPPIMAKQASVFVPSPRPQLTDEE